MSYDIYKYSQQTNISMLKKNVDGFNKSWSIIIVIMLSINIILQGCAFPNSSISWSEIIQEAFSQAKRIDPQAKLVEIGGLVSGNIMEKQAPAMTHIFTFETQKGQFIELTTRDSGKKQVKWTISDKILLSEQDLSELIRKDVKWEGISPQDAIQKTIPKVNEIAIQINETDYTMVYSIENDSIEKDRLVYQLQFNLTTHVLFITMNAKDGNILRIKQS